MPNIIRIKRRLSGDAGAPQTLENGELAFNEVDNTLYYGALSTIGSIAGSGSFATLNTSQTISGDKTFSSSVVLSSAVAETKATATSGDSVATTEFVQNVFSVLDGGDFDDMGNGGGGGGGGNNGGGGSTIILTTDGAEWTNSYSWPNNTLPTSADTVILSCLEVSIDLDAWTAPFAIDMNSAEDGVIRKIIAYSSNGSIFNATGLLINNHNGDLTLSGNAILN